MKFSLNMTTAIDQAIGQPLEWELGADFAELNRAVSMENQRFAVQFAMLYESCFVDDWSENRGFLKTVLTPEQQAMMNFWQDARLNSSQTEDVTAQVRAVIWARLTAAKV